MCLTRSPDTWLQSSPSTRYGSSAWQTGGVHTWWSWYCRAAHPTGRLEAITSRPLLLAAVGKAASHANRTTLYLTPLHGRADVLRKLIANVGAALQHVKAAAEQFKETDRWGCLLRYISDRIAPVIGQPKPPPGLLAAG